MEMPTLGQRCAHDECKQLDFLPFACSHCGRVFCREHFAPGGHACPNAVDRVVNVEEIAPFVSYPCASPACVARSPLEMRCPACLKHFCLAHRHHGCADVPREEERERWEEPRRRFEVARAEADRQVDENLGRAAGKAGGVGKTARKVQLMRLKGRAVGSRSVPAADRVYFLVHTPKGSGREPRAVYVCRQWTLGRAIDDAARLCDVANKNNEGGGGVKLRLFRKSDGAALADRMDQRLDELLGEGAVEDGESLVLEYVEDGSSGRLEDVGAYQD